ncbi:DUF1330 domain-containing protein [Cupriavidus sp. BIS7]|uniref:DUF1330 domain-containing protein n=1 Tax=Cupriavidus sp. BIS7 TaxID=1217718 RepID=UPI0003010212|nr:DUF1330 domain-containing protein [Cupriavidus sp. BIS7]
MAAYVIANFEVLDAAALEGYRHGAPATIEKYGGRYLVRGGAVDVLEGEFVPKHITVLEFPSVEHAKAWYESPEYRVLLKQRQAASRCDGFIVAGV